MVKVKHEEIESKPFLKKKAENIAAPGAEGKAGMAEAGSELLALWGDAVESLRARSFSSEEEAVSAVIETVLERFGRRGPVEPGLQEFLLDLFDTDPELKEELKNSLGIRG